MQLLVYKINLLEYKYTLSLFWQSTAQILNKNQLFWTTTVKLSYLHALELNIKMKLNVLNRQQLSELSLIISTLHRAVAQTVKKISCLREPVYFYNSSQCQMCKQCFASWDQFNYLTAVLSTGC